MTQQCTDKVIGGILAGWRYDISGLAPEMRGDYEAHFAECARCRSRQKLHRTIDISLIGVATVSAFLFLVAFLAVRKYSLQHALILEVIALGGFAFSTLMWVVVAVATPAPLVMVDAAKMGARRLHDSLPEKVRDRIPDEVKQRIS